MMTGLAILVFGSAMSTAVYAIAMTIVPNVDKIVAVLNGGSQQQPFEPLASLVQAERQIAVTRWAAAPLPRPTLLQYREAA